MRNPPLISVVLGTYNRLEFLKLTIQSIRQELAGFRHEILVVDGGSTDGTGKWLIAQKDVITIIQHNRGEWMGKPIERRSWGYFMNLVFKAAKGKYVCMVSDDCLVIPGAIRNGYALFEEKLSKGDRVGSVAFYWRNWPQQKEYRVGLTLGNKMFPNHGLFLKDALEKIGYIDEDTFEFYHADGDLCLKMWDQGYTCIDSPDSFIEHYSHANLKVRTSNAEKQQADWRNYLLKWEGKFYDPAKKNIGDWILKEFDDKYETWKLFSSLHEKIHAIPVSTKIKLKIRSILKR